MALDQTANFVRGDVDASIASGDTTISVADATVYPDPSNGEYNLVLWDDDNYRRPDLDPSVEIVRVTGRDTTNNNLTVSRGQENTTAASHPSTSSLHLSNTSKLFTDLPDEFVDVLGDTMSGGLTIDSSTSGETLLDLQTSDGISLSFEATGADASGSAEEVALYGPDGNEQMRWADATGNTTMGSALDMDKNDIIRIDNLVSSSSTARLETRGGGSNDWKVYDAANSQDIAVFTEGGAVSIPNGSLSVSDASGSDFVAESGDTMSGSLNFGNTNSGVQSEGNTVYTAHHTYPKILLREVDSDAPNFEIENDTDSRQIFQAEGTGRITVPNGNLRLATGQAIEDGGGTERIQFTSSETRLQGETGSSFTRSIEVGSDKISLRSDKPINFRDELGTQTAVQYDPDTSAGVLRTPNAGVRVEDIATPSSGEGVEIIYDSNTPRGTISSYDRDASAYRDIQINGSQINLDAKGGRIDLSGGNNDLRLGTGQAIEDGSGTNRIIINSNNTKIKDETGFESFRAESAFGGGYIRKNGDGNVLYDDNGGYSVISYTTSASAPGTLQLTNADLTIGSSSDFRFSHDTSADELVISGDDGVELIRQPKSGATQFLQGADIGSIEAPEDSLTQLANAASTSAATSGDTVGYTFAVDNQTLLSTKADADGSGGITNSIVDIPNSNLRLATGQAIEDGGGTDRISFISGATSIKYHDGSTFVHGSRGYLGYLRAFSDTPVGIYDDEGDFEALKYTTSASAPGTLELTNADLDVGGNHINSVNSITVSRNGLNAGDSWLEINGGSNGILANYDDNNEFRHYGNVNMYSGADLIMGDGRITNLGDIRFNNSEHADLADRGLAWDNSEGGGGMAGGLIVQDTNSNNGWVVHSSQGAYDIQKNGTDGTGVINFKT